MLNKHMKIQSLNILTSTVVFPLPIIVRKNYFFFIVMGSFEFKLDGVLPVVHIIARDFV